jgi:hypothetical protein
VLAVFSRVVVVHAQDAVAGANYTRMYPLTRVARPSTVHHERNMSLDLLRDLSISIIRSSLSHPLGFVSIPSSGETPFSPKERRLLDLHRELDTLSQQIVEARESTGLPERRKRFDDSLNSEFL